MALGWGLFEMQGEPVVLRDDEGQFIPGEGAQLTPV